MGSTGTGKAVCSSQPVLAFQRLAKGHADLSAQGEKIWTCRYPSDG